jgi:hypothetical protein
MPQRVCGLYNKKWWYKKMTATKGGHLKKMFIKNLT